MIISLVIGPVLRLPELLHHRFGGVRARRARATEGGPVLGSACPARRGRGGVAFEKGGMIRLETLIEFEFLNSSFSSLSSS